MSAKQHEELDIHEIERRVAVALIALVDDARERQRITPKLLAERSKLSLRRVREVASLWGLSQLSGDEYTLGPGSVERIRARAAELARD